MDYDFVRPVHYEKIEFAKGSSSVNAKILKRQMIEEFTRQKHEQQRTLSSLDVSTSSQQSSSISSQPSSVIEFSIVLENLADHGHLSLQTDVASAFYCMLINCNENKLFMRNNAKTWWSDHSRTTLQRSTQSLHTFLFVRQSFQLIRGELTLTSNDTCRWHFVLLYRKKCIDRFRSYFSLCRHAQMKRVTRAMHVVFSVQMKRNQ